MYDVMIIDDEVDVREHLISIIDWDHLPLRLAAHAADCETARELYLLHQPKIIITDINLSMGSGLDLAEEFMKLDPTMQCIVITGYSDFNYAQRALRMGAVEFLLKPIFPNAINESLQKAISRFEALRSRETSTESMRRLIDENAHTVQNAYLGRLFRFGHEGTIPAEAKFRELQIDCPGPYYAVALLALARNGQLERYESACLLMEKQMRKMLLETGLQFHLFFDSYFRLTCLVGASDKNLDTILEDSVSKLKSYLHFLDEFRLMAGISCAVEGAQQLKDAFSQAKTSLNFQNVLSEDSVIHYKNVNAYEPVQVNSRNAARELYHLFLQKDWTALEKNLTEYMQSLSLEENGLSQIRSFSLELLASLSSECSRQNLPLESALSTTNMLQVLSGTTWQEITSATLNTVSGMMEMQTSQHSSNNHHLIEMAKAYLDAHLQDSTLCLESVSEAIGLSKSYFCDLFHKTESVSFSNYLKSLRIEKSKELLKNTNLKVFEVADAVGFSNVKYFCFVFKKEVGKTPSEYQSASS